MGHISLGVMRITDRDADESSLRDSQCAHADKGRTSGAARYGITVILWLLDATYLFVSSKQSFRVLIGSGWPLRARLTFAKRTRRPSWIERKNQIGYCCMVFCRLDGAQRAHELELHLAI
jgi:hypothetical protein